MHSIINKMKKWLYAFLIILIAVIIYFLSGSDEQDLGDNYYFLPEYEAIDVGFPDGAIIYKAPEKYIFNDIIIHRDVTNAKSNADYIIATQKVDSLGVKEVSILYYIIEKNTELIYWPLNRQEFVEKRNELSIPERLRF
jgi:hypothetical protein